MEPVVDIGYDVGKFYYYILFPYGYLAVFKLRLHGLDFDNGSWQ